MTDKLIQKHFFNGTREYEIAGAQVNVCHNTIFGRKMHSIALGEINPEPVIRRSRLEFVRRDNGETVISLRLAKPDLQRFNDFVKMLSRCALDENHAVTGGARDIGTAALSVDDVDSVPPEFFEPGATGARIKQKVDAEQVATAIEMLQTYMHDVDIDPLIIALEALRKAPQDEANLTRVERAFNDLGINQGAVLTYSPYIAALLSDDPFASA